MSLYDPLLEFESQHKKQKPKKIKTSRYKTFLTTKPKSIGQIFVGFIRLVTTYILLSGTIFAVMMGGVNFSAYSARIGHWINPNAYAETNQEIQSIISQSQSTIEEEASKEDTNREFLEEKIALNDPDLVYSHTYQEDTLLANIPLKSAESASFQVVPQENRIIIPKLGKNIPLIETEHDENISFSEMHKIFLEELKKGVVRYPGTAKPGEVGNAFIFGHSSNYPWIKSDYNDIFALLDTLKNGDEIIVYYEQKKYVYRVTDRAEVRPGDTKVLNSRDPKKKEISLMTCWPVGTTLKRLIIFGELVENTSNN